MIKGIYGIYDKKAEMFNEPFFAVNDLIAKRTFRTIVNDKNAVNQYPKDFKLVKVAVMNMVTGAIVGEDGSRYEVEASDVKEDKVDGKAL